MANIKYRSGPGEAVMDTCDLNCKCQDEAQIIRREDGENQDGQRSRWRKKVGQDRSK